MEILRLAFDTHAPEQLRKAIKEWALSMKSKRKADGWALLNGGTIPEGHQWMRFGDKTYIKPIPHYEERRANIKPRPPSPPVAEPKLASMEMACPICGEKAFPQPVCPNCEKGKSGMKTMWVCGNDPDHFFYTEF